MGAIADEVLLGRLRREAAAREAELAALRAELAGLEKAFDEKLEKLAARTRQALRGEATAAIVSAQRVITDANFALAERIDLMEARVTDGETTSLASIEEFRRVTATNEFALAEMGVVLTARIAGNQAQVAETLTAYATKTFAEAKKTEALAASTAYTDAGLLTESIARADTDTAIASTVTTLSTQVNHATTGLPAAHAAITSESSTRATQDSALSAQIVSLSAQVNDPTTGLPSAHARVTTETTARASADSALSGQISTLNSTVGTLSSTVSTETSNRIAADGQIHARWGVALDVNGRITGKVQLDGSNSSSTFTVLADAIRFYNGTTDIAPFAVSGGVVSMPNVVVDNIKANVELTTPTIMGGAIKMSGTECKIVVASALGSDAGIIRLNGGGDHGPTRGGQVDVTGNDFATVPGYPGSILLTPGGVSGSNVSLRDGALNVRVKVTTGGIDLNGNTSLNGSLTATGDLAANDVTCNGQATFTDDALVDGGNALHFFATGNGTYIKEDYGLQLWGAAPKPVQVGGASLALCDVSGGGKDYGAGRLYFKESAAGGGAGDYYLWVDGSGDLQFHKGGSGDVFIA